MSEDIVERLRSWRQDSFPADPSLEAAAEIERLRARVAVLHDALSATDTWLGAALKCPGFQWDADQKQAAQHDYDEARAALEAKP